MNRFHPFLDRLSYLFLIPAGILAVLGAERGTWITLCLLFVLCITANEIRLFVSGRRKKNLAHAIVDMLNMTSQKRLVDFPVPIVISDEKGIILWYNEAFTDATSEQTLLTFHNVRQLTKDI
ncbi:MAG: hypothetical protein J6B54_02525, partial [Clostridia bacterium]|nr:hypothetical protein [Clostridia bacterium]